MSNMEQPPSQLHKIEQNNTSMDCTVPNTDTAVKLEESVVEYASLPVTLDKSFSETPAGVSLQNATHPPPSPSTDMTSSPSACLPGLYSFLQYFQCSFFSVNVSTLLCICMITHISSILDSYMTLNMLIETFNKI